MIDPNSTTYNVLIIIGFILLIFILAFFRYVEYLEKRDLKQRAKKTDPFTKAFIYTLIVAVLILLGEMLGALEQGTFKKKYYLLLILLCVFLVLFMIQDYLNKPLGIKKCLAIAERESEGIWNSRDLTGQRTFLTGRKHGKIVNNDACFKLNRIRNDIIVNYAIKVDNRDGNIVEFIEAPLQKEIQQVFEGKSVLPKGEIDEVPQETANQEQANSN